MDCHLKIGRLKMVAVALDQGFLGSNYSRIVHLNSGENSSRLPVGFGTISERDFTFIYF